jgi:hypothetical protein
MPVTTTYPGVYIEELPSGVHTIAGVATSIAVFIGWAAKGPVDEATLVLSWSDFNNQFGGLNSHSYLGYAVSHFFTNGGQQAYIIRLAGSDAKKASDTLSSLTVSAQNAGEWANDYSIAIKNPSGGTGRFRLQVLYTPPGSPAPPATVVESFENLGISSPDAQGRYVADVVNNGSSLIHVAVSGTTVPATGTSKLGTGTPGVDGAVLTPNGADFETALAPLFAEDGVLDQIDLFNLLCVPGETKSSTLQSLEACCERSRAFLIADSDPTITNVQTVAASGPDIPGANAAFYFPWVMAPDLLNQNISRSYPPCGFVAGVYAATDASRGVWKAPAGTATGLVGTTGVAVSLTDAQNGVLNPAAVNCIRNFSVYGTVVWGARTTQGNDETGSQWKYIPVRRLALYLETSLYRGTQWVVFEPNDEPLWAQIRLNVGAFMQTLFRQGAFQGTTPQQAYFVKCDGETTTSTDQNNGIVNILVGFAPLKPAEFVIIQIQQMAGQTAA